MEHAAVPGMAPEQILQAWIGRYAATILKTCFVCLSDRAQAEDATQDTFIKAWRHLPEFQRKGVANEKAWLLKIAINTCRDYRRTAWFRHVDTRTALEDLPPRLMEAGAEDHDLMLTVCGLPDRYKQVVLLYYYHGLTEQETADSLGLSLATVSRRLRKAEVLLRAALEGGEQDA